MPAENRLLYIMIFLAVFVLNLIVGLASRVSVIAGIVRAFYTAVFFTALSLGMSYLIRRCILNDLIPAGQESATGEIVGKRIDIMVSESSPEAETVFESFAPLTAGQIDPQVEKIINGDPKRMAEIVKKMGFEN